MSLPPAGSVVLVTGSARGIGAATARLAAARGRRVAINYARNKEAAEQGVRDIAAAGGEALSFQADVADEAAVVAMFEAIENELGTIDALVNNAGVDGSRGPIQNLDVADVRHLLDVNVIGTMICCREAARRMSRANVGRGGAIVNVSSMATTIGGRQGNAVYVASKAAIDVSRWASRRTSRPKVFASMRSGRA